IYENIFNIDTGCGANEEKKSCGTACEPTCAEPNPGCTKQCVVNACQCKQAYIRDKKGGACISVDDCPRDPIKPCSEMNCPYGTRCVPGRVICPFVPPCFTRQTRCEPNRATTGGPATTCEGFKCPTGKKCQMIYPPCLPDVSCPPPSPECV
ncbi:unnamed protein product, partial [Nippostrongylus brasiliensis]|uniref:TIL domain-containing protein n=1 Tax=Nippostrongylus brasiliensis TaxID=27835 RepID=A0A0N4YNK9_NIPBR